LRLLHGDLDENGRYDVLEAIFNPAVKDYISMTSPEFLIEHLPSVAERITTFDAYAGASLDQVLGPAGANAAALEINTLDSMIFLNRGSTFEARPLPIEVQFAPVFGIVVADFDNDSNEDLALGQNLFETRWEMGRLDSGRPLWLRGDGKGGFSTVLPAESGLTADGQQRAVAVADFDRDGRIDIAMSQNNGPTKLFQNAGGKPGASIRFAGPESNPDAIGTRYRVFSAKGNSPAREIQAGGGWLSQSSVVHVIRRPEAGSRLQVRWPDGTRNDFELASGSEFIVSRKGVKIVR
jgi:hypothetical protein